MSGYSFPALGGGVSRGMVTNGLTGGAPTVPAIVVVVCYQGDLRLDPAGAGQLLLAVALSGDVLTSPLVSGSPASPSVAGTTQPIPTVTGPIIGYCC
jgi:hypothetical protein